MQLYEVCPSYLLCCHPSLVAPTHLQYKLLIKTIACRKQISLLTAKNDNAYIIYNNILNHNTLILQIKYQYFTFHITRRPKMTIRIAHLILSLCVARYVIKGCHPKFYQFVNHSMYFVKGCRHPKRCCYQFRVTITPSSLIAKKITNKPLEPTHFELLHITV